jgi:predicted Rossmann-fold nucleotide-binding protein
VGTEFWNPLLDFIENIQKKKFETISPEDTDLFTISDDIDEIVEIAKNAPMRNE